MATKLRNSWLFIIWLFLFSFGVSGLLFVLLHSSQYIGKDYFDTDTFRSQLDEFTSLLLVFGAETSMKEDVKEAITVSDEDIEEYRYRYGDLNEQLTSIKAQYEDKIAISQAEKNKEAVEMYIAERDKKLKDITQNFASDEYVENKIIKETEQGIDDYFQGVQKNNRSTYNEYRKVFIYDLKGLNNNRIYRHEVDALAEKGPLFIRSYPFKGEYLGFNSSLPYVDGVDENVMEQLNSIVFTEFQGEIAIPKTAPASHPIMVQYHDHRVKQNMMYVYGLLSVLALLISFYLYKKGNINPSIMNGNWVMLYHRIPMDVRAGILMFTVICLLLQLDVFMNQLLYYNLGNLDFIRNCIAYLLSISILTGLVLLQIKDFIVTIRSNFQAEWKQAIIYRSAGDLQKFFLHRSISWQMLMLLTESQ